MNILINIRLSVNLDDYLLESQQRFLGPLAQNQYARDLAVAMMRGEADFPNKCFIEVTPETSIHQVELFPS